MIKNYNFQRKRLILPEYGRHIHEMIDFLLTIENRALRNQQALSVIAVMGNINPVLRDSADFTHKLWDHLFMMSEFKLDVDSPYPIPSAEKLQQKPERLKYPKVRIARKHYGKHVEQVIKALDKERTEENKQEVLQALNNVAKYMRTKGFEYNQEHPNNEAIIRDIKLMSGNGIVLDEVAINNLRSEYRPPMQSRPPTSKNPRQGSGGYQQNRPAQSGRPTNRPSGGSSGTSRPPSRFPKK